MPRCPALLPALIPHPLLAAGTAPAPLSEAALGEVDPKDVQYRITILEEQMHGMEVDLEAIDKYRTKDGEYGERARELEGATAERDEVGGWVWCLLGPVWGAVPGEAGEARCQLPFWRKHNMSSLHHSLPTCPSSCLLVCLPRVCPPAPTPAPRQVRREHEELRKRRLDEFMSGFNTVSLKLKEMYQMITMGGDAELELVDSLDPFSGGWVGGWVGGCRVSGCRVCVCVGGGVNQLSSCWSDCHLLAAASFHVA